MLGRQCHRAALIFGAREYLTHGQGDSTEGLWLDASYLVGSEDEGFYVWAADKHDKLEKRTVKAGSFDETLNRYEITDGLSPEDYIAFPADDLQEGAPVVKNDTISEDNNNSGIDIGDMSGFDGGDGGFDGGIAVEPTVGG